jgi:hypothetical protein
MLLTTPAENTTCTQLLCTVSRILENELRDDDDDDDDGEDDGDDDP